MKIIKTDKKTKKSTIISLQKAREEVVKDNPSQHIYFPNPITKLETNTHTYQAVKWEK